MEKIRLKRGAICAASAICILFASCGGSAPVVETCEHKFKKSDKISASACTEEGYENIVCRDCEEVLEQLVIPAVGHRYLVDETKSVPKTCTTDGLTVEQCYRCGDERRETLAAVGHSYVAKDTAYSHLKSKTEEVAEYYISCADCHKNGQETFTASIPDKSLYQFESPTLTLYETQDKLSYGFTWNCQEKPLSPVIQLREKGAGEDAYYDAVVEEYAVETGYHYVCKAVVELQPNLEYVYKIAEAASAAESVEYTFTALDTKKKEFSFASFSDTQNKEEDGSGWNQVLQRVGDVDFYLHSGDICEDTTKEAHWKAMLDYNREYFAVKPLMAAAGNHDTIYKSSANAFYKHFNNKIPSQNTEKGYYYSFYYGNAKFIVINTNDYNSQDSTMRNDQYDWLVKELRDNDAKWTIVTMHCPMYSVGQWGATKPTQSWALRNQLKWLFAEYGVDIVLQGHDHVDVKTHPIDAAGKPIPATVQTVDGIDCAVNPEGTIYIMNGPSGPNQRNPEGRLEGEYYEYEATGWAYSWAEYTVTEEKLTVKVKHLSSDTVVDDYTWGILKTEQLLGGSSAA